MSIRKNSNQGYTLVEVIIAISLMVVMMGGMYFFFVSGMRQAGSGSKKLASFHRLRVVTEILKDSLRESVDLPPNSEYTDSLEFTKFSKVSGDGDKEVTPQTRKVKYTFDNESHKLVGTYGPYQVINTDLFNKVEFKKYRLLGKSFVRMKFNISKDKSDPSKTITVLHSIGSRYLNTYYAKQSWFPIQETLPEEE
ncbi:prepilin-type N-terminal cleavage/methylation domain-containing protein [bacterium]|nr:prepilin-type N-terminal cleavage/methylation domain-containing protein [bacterium]